MSHAEINDAKHGGFKRYLKDSIIFIRVDRENLKSSQKE